MSFRTRNFEQIVADALAEIYALTPQLTDFNEGSKLRSLIEAIAHEIDAAYVDMEQGLIEAVEAGAYRAFRFGRLPASPAFGPVTFSRSTPAPHDIPIPAGTIVEVPGTTKAYRVASDAVLIAGSTSVTVRVVALVPGAAGNTLAHTITQLRAPIPGIESVTNPSPFLNGRDEESDEERRLRFVDFLRSLARGTKDALVAGAKTAKLVEPDGLISEYVAQAICRTHDEDPSIPLGEARVYIYNGRGGTSPQLVAECQRIIDGYTDDQGQPVPGYKGAGIVVRVLPATEQTQDVALAVTPMPGFTVDGLRPVIEKAVMDVFARLRIGQALLRSELIRAVKNIEGVYNVNLTAPPADVVPAPIAVVRLGSLSIG